MSVLLVTEVVVMGNREEMGAIDRLFWLNEAIDFSHYFRGRRLTPLTFGRKCPYSLAVLGKSEEDEIQQ